MTKAIETGNIKNKCDGSMHTYEMRVLDTKNIEEILTLQHQILSTMENPEVCVYLTTEEVSEMLDGFGDMIGIFVKDSLIAFGASLYPGEREENLGRDIGLEDLDLTKGAHLEFAAVHPEYRGNSLQKKLAGFLVEKIIESGRYDYLMNTISPYNPVSLDTDFFLGFFIKKLSRKYGDSLRYIMLRDLKNPKKINRDSIIAVKASDLERQQELLERGYYGVGFEDGMKGENILFAKVVCE